MPITWPFLKPARKYLASIVGSIMLTLPPRTLPAKRGRDEQRLTARGRDRVVDRVVGDTTGSTLLVRMPCSEFGPSRPWKLMYSKYVFEALLSVVMFDVS